VLFFFALHFQQVRGFSPLATSGAFLPYGLALLVAGPISGWFATRVSVHVIIAAGLLLGALGLLLLARIGVDAPYTGAVLTGLLVFPVGIGLTLSGATVAAADGAPHAEAGVVGAMINVALETGPPVGLALLASLASVRATRLSAAGLPPTAAVTAGYSYALIAAALVFLICAGLALTAMAPRGRSREHS
jgi:predicted MFS family arabinose efflux permease